MTARFAIVWSIWIGVVAGIYCFLYINSPLAESGVMPCSFIALPMFFITGAKREEILDFCSSAVAGVAWALVFIALIGWFVSVGLSAAMANALGICIATAVLCVFHFIVTKKYAFTKVPMMFGAIAATFFAGGDKWLPLMITLCLGVVLAYICQIGALLFNADGSLNTNLFKKSAPAEGLEGSGE